MASKLSPPSNIITRKKKRDLEATMKSLKKRLAPSRSRKKNIPRSIPKKLAPKETRTICRKHLREHNSDGDGEYYPNRLKRKNEMKRIVLKTKHELKVVVATNKRKRGIPCKGLGSIEENHGVLNNTHECNSLSKLSNKTQATELPTQSILKSPFRDFRKLPLSVQTPTKITKYELVSPPHRSLTELTTDDLMRMDEDSLSSEDLREIATCPSPVWWEDHPSLDSEEGALSLDRTDDMGEENEVIEETADEMSIINPTGNNTDLKRANTVIETKKSKKMAKLESILGNIKNRVQNKFENNERVADKVSNYTSKDDSVVNGNVNEICNVSNRTDDHDELNRNLKETDKENQLENNESDVTKDRDSPIEVDTKRRKISTSGSDMSVNDEDLLRNLENINIPIFMADTDGTKGKDDKENSKDCDGEPKAVTHVQDLEIQTTNGSTSKEVARPDTVDIVSTQGIVITDKQKDIQKQLDLLTDDILDVRLLKIPTKATNQLKIWSKIENIQRHNLKPEEFEKSFDVEDELVFSMIKCNNKIEPETICIDDDDDEPMEDSMNLDAIGKKNDKIDSNSTDSVKIIIFNDNQETITLSKDLDRLIETPIAMSEMKETQVSDNIMTKPKQVNQAEKKIEIELPNPKDAMTNPKQNCQAVEAELPKPNKEQSNNEIQGVKIRPTKQPSPNTNKKKNKMKSTKNRIQKDAKDKTIWKNKGVKIIKTKNDSIIRIKDIDISIMNADHHNIEQNKTKEVKNAICITLIKDDSKSDKRIEVPSKTPVILPPLKRIVNISNKSDKEKNLSSLLKPGTLPSLTKNPNSKFESPKSIKSISSEGTISDTNIQFLDEYDDAERPVDIVFEGKTIEKTDTKKEGKTKNKEAKNERKKRKIEKKKRREEKSIKSPAQIFIENK